jgi:hypothetical protein
MLTPDSPQVLHIDLASFQRPKVYDELLSNFAFKFNLHHYTLVQFNEVAKFSVLRLQEYFSNQVKGRKCVSRREVLLPRSRKQKIVQF